MKETYTIAQETVIIRAPGSPEINWRRQRLVSLGASADLAAEIAESDVDVHDIARLLKAGSSLELAWSIMRPVGPPSAAVAEADEAAS